MTQPALAIATIDPQLLMALRLYGFINGTGPGTWKLGHFKVRSWFTIPTPHGNAAAEQHDLDYLVGGSEEDRELADQRYHAALKAMAKEQWIGARWLLMLEAWAFYRAIRIDGKNHWHKAPARTLDDLWLLVGVMR